QGRRGGRACPGGRTGQRGTSTSQQTRKRSQVGAYAPESVSKWLHIGDGRGYTCYDKSTRRRWLESPGGRKRRDAAGSESPGGRTAGPEPGASGRHSGGRPSRLESPGGRK